MGSPSKSFCFNEIHLLKEGGAKWARVTFSRNTFDKLKHYVGVRLQQGVPIVDADWNELEDIRKYELGNVYQVVCGKWGVPSLAMMVF